MSWGSGHSYDNDTFFNFLDGKRITNENKLKELLQKSIQEYEILCGQAKDMPEMLPLIQRTHNEIQLGLIVFAVTEGVAVSFDLREKARTLIKSFLTSDYLDSFKSDEETKKKYRKALRELEADFNKGLKDEEALRIHRGNLETALYDEFVAVRKLALIKELNILS